MINRDSFAGTPVDEVLAPIIDDLLHLGKDVFLIGGLRIAIQRSKFRVLPLPPDQGSEIGELVATADVSRLFAFGEPAAKLFREFSAVECRTTQIGISIAVSRMLPQFLTVGNSSSLDARLVLEV